MKYYIKGKGPVDLNKNDFLAQGGQGAVYAQGSTAFKIYLDPACMIPVAKIQELAPITSEPYIIGPQDILMDSKNNPVGYTMRFVKNTHALCQTFTKDFRTKNNFTNDMVIRMVRNMQKGTEYIHSKDIIIVDYNELNFLVDNKFDDVYFIDVDSYQTRSFPATVIMDNIRDRHSKVFSRETDWFSWGIVTFQMFIGIHPYRGGYPKVKEMDDRMKQNISVFHNGVILPAMCRPFTVIPDNYRAWYKAVFEDGKRLPPPKDLQAVIFVATAVKQIKGSNNFLIDLSQTMSDDILYYGFIDGTPVILTKGGLFANNKLDDNVTADSCIAITPKLLHVIAAKIENGKAIIYDSTGRKVLQSSIAAEQMMSYQGRLYVKNHCDVHEVQFVEVGTMILSTIKAVANVLEKATQMFDGVVIQDVLGSWFASVFPKAGVHYQTQVKELQGYKIINAKFDKGVLMIIAAKKGKYDKFILRFASDYGSYDVRVVADVATNELNFTVLDSGICAHINEDEKMEIFLAKRDAPDIKVIDDPAISSDMKLCHKGTQTMFFKDNELYTITMTKKKP